MGLGYDLRPPYYDKIYCVSLASIQSLTWDRSHKSGVHLHAKCVYIYSWVQITFGITLCNITPPNNLLLDSYFKDPTVELHILYMLNMHTNFNINKI